MGQWFVSSVVAIVGQRQISSSGASTWLLLRMMDEGNEGKRLLRLRWALAGAVAREERRFRIRDRRDRFVLRCVEETEEAVIETIS